MSIIQDCESRALLDFPGADLLRDKIHLSAQRIPGAILARNVEFIHGSVFTRRGFGELYDPNLDIHSIYNWVPGERNSLILFSRNAGAPKVVERNLVAGTSQDISTSLNAATTNCIFAEIGSRIFMAYINSAGAGISNGRVWNGSVGGTDDLFQAPLSEGSNFSVAYADPSSGVVTAGSHKFGIVFETRNGYLTKAVEFATPYTAPGSENATVQLTPASTWPSWVLYGHLIMTTVSNPNRFFFVPGERRAIDSGGSTPTTWFADIDDTSLSGLGEGALATEYFNILSSGELGTPSKPKLVIPYGERMIYVEDLADAGVLAKVSHIYISDPGDAQHISAYQHLKFLPSKLQVVTGFVIGKTLYLLGPSWTYAFNDTNDKPVLWDKADLVDGQRGTPSPHGVSSKRAASGGTIWVADRAGLFPFSGGYYPELPTSYLQTPDWERINWSAPAGTVQVVDDTDSDTVLVQAPFDGSNVATHILAWDYKNGIDWSRAKYSIHDIDGVSPGAIALFKNQSNGLNELLVSNSTADSVFRRKSSQAGDANIYNDNSNPIDSQYTSPPVVNSQVPVQHVAAHLAIKGSGAAALTAYNKNQARSTSLGDETLAAAPEADVLVLIGEQTEAVSIGVTNKNTVDSWFSLSRVIEYFREWVQRR